MPEIYKVESSSRYGLFHTVTDHETFMTCTCEGYKYKKSCAHIQEVIQELNKKYAKPSKES